MYAAGLALWQRRLTAHADAVVVPSRFAEQRLRALARAARRRARPRRAHVQRTFAERSAAAAGAHALVASRLAREKGVEVAVEACARAGVPLVVAGDGPLAETLKAAAPPGVRFAGRVGDAELAALRARAALAIVPSRAAETMGLAAVEAMAAGVPVVASAVGALPEVIADPRALAPPGDAIALAAAVSARYGDAGAGERGLARAREICAPEVVADRLAAVVHRAAVGRYASGASAPKRSRRAASTRRSASRRRRSSYAASSRSARGLQRSRLGLDLGAPLGEQPLARRGRLGEDALRLAPRIRDLAAARRRAPSKRGVGLHARALGMPARLRLEIRRGLLAHDELSARPRAPCARPGPG